jgi:hypothetical protein
MRAKLGTVDVLERATEFLWTNARTLERRVFECLFLDGPADAVVASLEGYRNADGGLGHALEPDLRAPGSQPADVEFGLAALEEAGARAPKLCAGLCEYLSGVADERGFVPAITADAQSHACAGHWMAPRQLEPGPGATFGTVGLLHAQGAHHPWLTRATEACWATLGEAVPREAHALQSAFRFVAHAPSGDAEAAAAALRDALPGAEWFVADVPVTQYGLTPLDFLDHVPFGDELIDAHVDDLASRQLPDGGWPISWEPPGETARAEWRGRWTLTALAILRRRGRI